MDKILNVLSDLKAERNIVIVSGIIPKPRMNRVWQNMALSLDSRLQATYKRLGLVFIDNWIDFHGNVYNYISDGVHLNTKGTEILENFS